MLFLQVAPRFTPFYLLSCVPFTLFSIFWYSSFSPATAHLVNVTVDDDGADPLTGERITYFTNTWVQGAQCPLCWAQPNASQTYSGTWHDATYRPGATEANEVDTQTAQFNFTGAFDGRLLPVQTSLRSPAPNAGTAVYVYGILSLSVHSGPSGPADIIFTIDGGTTRPVEVFSFTPNGPEGQYSYDTLLWYTDHLPNGQHSFRLQNGIPNRRDSLILLDYIIYTRSVIRE